jgi:hypothetical protein
LLKRLISIGFIWLACHAAYADAVKDAIETAMKDLKVVASDDPYSKSIERMFLGFCGENKPRIGIAYRTIKSHKPITGVVIVEKTNEGYILREALFPDINRIRNAKDRNQVLTVLANFKNVPFDPHAEKSAVDTVSGATRYGLKTTGYLNYMARRIALEMETLPDWVKTDD